MEIGIDKIGFYTSHYYLDMQVLAEARGIDVTKFYDDLGQKKMAIAAPGEDVVTLALNAAEKVLKDVDLSSIEMVLFATESSVDASKAAATYIHKILNLPSRCRVIELKQACYGATFGLQVAMAMVRQNPQKKVLLIAADVAKYSMNSAAESSQGCGAVAMLFAANPRLLAIEPEAGFCTKETMDFWRPNYSDVPFLDGRLSCDIFMRLAEECWKQYAQITGRNFIDHDRFCYHTPVPKLVEKTHKRLARVSGFGVLTDEQARYQIANSLVYAAEVGNCYTASLYLGIISLLENAAENLAGKLIGLYSYGSGSSAEFFAARVVADCKSQQHRSMLDQRIALSYSQYEEFHNFKLPADGSSFVLPVFATGNFRLQALDGHKRIYAKADNGARSS